MKVGFKNSFDGFEANELLAIENGQTEFKHKSVTAKIILRGKYVDVRRLWHKDHLLQMYQIANNDWLAIKFLKTNNITQDSISIPPVELIEENDDYCRKDGVIYQILAMGDLALLKSYKLDWDERPFGHVIICKMDDYYVLIDLDDPRNSCEIKKELSQEHEAVEKSEVKIRKESKEPKEELTDIQRTPLNYYKSRELINELRRRGYKGTLTLTISM